jgi:oxygen-independent coproporphyrinogen III oxidase
MNHPLPVTYCAAVERGDLPIANTERISPETAMGETMMLGLRLLRGGVSAGSFQARHGVALDAVFGDSISDLARHGFVERAGDRVRLTPRGLMLANDVCARFV